MDHVTRLAQALSYDDTRHLQQSELEAMSTDELMSYIGRKDRAIESEKIASAELSPEEKFKMAEKWGRELAKTAGAVGDAAKVVVGKGLRAAKGASKSVGRRAAVGASAGAAGGTATELSKKDPTKKGVAKGAVAGALAGGALGAVAKPTAQKIVKMKGPVGDFARKSVNKSRLYDFVQAVKKPFTKTAGPLLGMAQKAVGAGMKMAVTTPGATRAAVGGALGAVGGAAGAQPGHRMGGALGGAAAGAMAGYAVKPIATAMGGMANRVGRFAGGALKNTAKATGSVPGMQAANQMQLKRIGQMAGRRINRQGTGMMGKLLPAGGPGAAAQQTINATRI